MSAPTETPIVELVGITKSFPGVLANDRVDLALHRGEVHCLLGENGAGKSTLIGILSGLHRPDEGTIRIEGVETALFLFGTVEGSNRLVASISGAVGLAAAVMLGYLFYRGAERLDLRRFFAVTSVLLLAFAAWLLAQGLHELQEAGALPESTPLLIAAFAVLAGPALYFFLRKPKPQATT